jgi:hypothetical protein
MFKEQQAMRRIIHTLIAALFIVMELSACATTAMYTKPSLINKSSNVYNFTIECGAFSGADTADRRAIQEIQRFMIANGYASFKIIHRTQQVFISEFKYKVKFSR